MFTPPAARRSPVGDIETPVVRFYHPSGKTVTFIGVLRHESKRASDALVELVNSKETVQHPGLHLGRPLTAAEQSWWDSYLAAQTGFESVSRTVGFVPWVDTAAQFTHAEVQDLTIDRVIGRLPVAPFPAEGTPEFVTHLRAAVSATRFLPTLAAFRGDRLLGNRSLGRERAGYAVHQALTAVADVDIIWPSSYLPAVRKSLRVYGFEVTDVQWRTAVHCDDLVVPE